jgi:ribosomal protein S18 acetylase RimI-like enzyme
VVPALSRRAAAGPAPYERAARVRRMRQEDVAGCADMIAGEALWRRYGLDALRARRMLRAALRAGGDLYVAVMGGHLAGFVWIRREGTFAHSGYVRLIGVARSARRAGVGRRLLDHAERVIFASGPNVFLLVSDFNRAAQRFYRKLGYAKVGALPDYVQPGITEYVYRKSRGPIAGPEPGRS